MVLRKCTVCVSMQDEVNNGELSKLPHLPRCCLLHPSLKGSPPATPHQELPLHSSTPCTPGNRYEFMQVHNKPRFGSLKGRKRVRNAGHYHLCYVLSTQRQVSVTEAVIIPRKISISSQLAEAIRQRHFRFGGS